MKGFIAAALLTLPLSLFAESGHEGAAGTTPAAAPAATTPAPTPSPAPAVMSTVTCVGKMGSALTDDQKKMFADAKIKANKNWKAEDVASTDQCKGAYTIQDGKVTKVQSAHKKGHK